MSTVLIIILIYLISIFICYQLCCLLDFIIFKLLDGTKTLQEHKQNIMIVSVLPIINTFMAIGTPMLIIIIMMFYLLIKIFQISIFNMLKIDKLWKNKFNSLFLNFLRIIKISIFALWNLLSTIIQKNKYILLKLSLKLIKIGK